MDDRAPSVERFEEWQLPGGTLVIYAVCDDGARFADIGEPTERELMHERLRWAAEIHARIARMKLGA